MTGKICRVLSVTTLNHPNTQPYMTPCYIPLASMPGPAAQSFDFGFRSLGFGLLGLYLLVTPIRVCGFDLLISFFGHIMTCGRDSFVSGFLGCKFRRIISRFAQLFQIGGPHDHMTTHFP